MSASVQCGSLGHDLRVFVAARRERALDLVSRLRVSGRGATFCQVRYGTRLTAAF